MIIQLAGPKSAITTDIPDEGELKDYARKDGLGLDSVTYVVKIDEPEMFVFERNWYDGRQEVYMIVKPA